MSFLGGAECSSADNPLTQFTKHVQSNKSLQRDRLGGRGPSGLGEGIRSQGMMSGQDHMINEFFPQEDQVTDTRPFAMEQMRRELENSQVASLSTASSCWAVEFDPGEQARMEATFPAEPKTQMMKESEFSMADFNRFSQENDAQRARIPIRSPGHGMSAYQLQMGMGCRGLGGGYMAMLGPTHAPMGVQEQFPMQEDKGKRKMVELDDKNWEAQFAEIEAVGETVSDERAIAAMEVELNDLDRQMAKEEVDFENIPMNEIAEWDDVGGVLHTHSFRDPQLGDYLFEEDNSYRLHPNPFEEGIRIMRDGGNLSLAVLAFEAAVQQDPKHVEAWTMLGSAQAQNEKESPAIRAYGQALKLDPVNLDSLMGLAVSYTNEGYDFTAFRTLERWLSVKYPQIISPNDISPDSDTNFTDRYLLQEKVTHLFIQAAQLSPQGEHMDPDVQVGLGVLFYGAEEYDKAVDCFSSALASNESGTSNQQEQVHLLWNRLGATLANSGRSEEAIEAYEKALTIRPNFVRARYNLGVSCINIGCYPEAVQHLLAALAMHQAVDHLEPSSAADIADGATESYITHNQSTNLYDTLRRVFNQMGRRDLSDMVVAGMDVQVFRNEFTF